MRSTKARVPQPVSNDGIVDDVARGTGCSNKDATPTIYIAPPEHPRHNDERHGPMALVD